MIINKGAEWFRSIGPEKSPGTKAFALTGSVRHTGLIEVPMGTTLREVIYDIGGGIKGDGAFKAVQIGGPSGGCLVSKDLDVSLDFDSLKKMGAMIGSGGLVVMDDHTCMVEVARRRMKAVESACHVVKEQSVCWRSWSGSWQEMESWKTLICWRNWRT